MSHRSKLQKAVREALVHADEPQEIEDINTFIALYDMLGETELYDAIQTTMEDENLQDAYYTIIEYYEEQEED